MSHQPPAASTPQRIPEGFLLSVSTSDRKKGIAMLIFGLVWTAFSAFILFLVARDSDYVGVFFLGLFLVAGCFCMGIGLLDLWISLKLYPAELVFSKYPLRLGETCLIHYRRRLRHGMFNQPGEMAAELVCDEWVQYRQGTDTKTKTHVLYELQLPTRSIVTGEHQADYESEIAISADAPPAFSAEHNQIRWRFIVKLKVPGIPKRCHSEFYLQVAPEMLARAS